MGMRKKEWVTIKCATCGKLFEVPPGLKGKTKCCSLACSRYSRTKYRFCQGCGVELSSEYKRGKEGISRRLCKTCYEKYKSDKKTNKRENYSSFKLFKDGVAKCKKCGEIKNIKEFYKDKKNIITGLSSSCKTCVNDHLSRYGKSERNYSNLKEKRKLEYHSDPKKKMNRRISAEINKHIKVGSKNRRHWENIVGYTVDDLMKHLQKQFDSNMSWDNHGKYWHIDHIIPLSALNFEKPEDRDFKIAWGLKNLRPLPATENRKKWNNPIYPVQKSIIFPVKNI